MADGSVAAARPDRAAVVVGRAGGADRVVTYGELDDGSARLARVLAGLGLRRGDHYAVLAENHPRYHEVVWAGLRSGLYVTAINSHLTADEAAYIVDDCGARVLVTTAALAEVATGLLDRTPGVGARLMLDGTAPGHEPYEEALASVAGGPLENEQRGTVMLYSSGTTGRPKGIEFPLPPPGPPFGEWEIAVHSAARFGWSEDMVYLSPAPLYHSAPLRTTLGVQTLGGTVVVMDRFDPVGALALIERWQVTHSSWVPTMFVRMLKLPEGERSRFDLSTHRSAVHAAAPCPVAVKERMIEWWGPIIEEYYSGTENFGSTAISSEEWLAHKGSVGRATPPAVIRICDEDGAEVAPGETGTVYFEDPRAEVVYHGDRDRTAAMTHPEHPTWRTLGDVGHLDDDGYLYLTDRRAFMIVSGGVNVYPQEVEDVLVAHPEVLDAAVFGVPDDELGEQVKALVQPVRWDDAGDRLAASLLEWCEGRLAGYKRPRSIEFERQLPRLDNGKLYKAPLRDRYWAGHASRVI
ncbi:MAG: acyl-CoA synthetase [Acidimicrobiales bacterium]